MKIKHADEIYSQQGNGGVVLYKERRGEVVELNETASFIWNRMKRSSSVGLLVKEMVRVYDVRREEAKKDVEDIINSLLREGYLKKIK